MVATIPSIPDWFAGLVHQNGGKYANDPTFLKIVASGAWAESGGFNVNAEQVPGANAGGKGLFQFDFSGGQGTGLLRTGVISTYQQAMGMSGAAIQAQHIIPAYAQAYEQGMARGLHGTDLGTFVIGQAERPRGWYLGAVQWNDSTYSNYKNALTLLLGGNAQVGATGVPVPDVTDRAQPQTGAQGSAQATTGAEATTGATTGADAPGMVKAAQVGPFELGVPSGLVLALLALFLLLVGAVLLNQKQAVRVAATLAEA